MTDHFLSCDWGTSFLRLRLVSRETATAVGEYRCEEGTAKLAAATTTATRADRFRETLLGAIRQLPAAAIDLEPLPVVISGMAGSSIGWRELPYSRLPFSLDGRDLFYQDLGALCDGRIAPTYLLSGVRSDRDVMRGEETEAMGIARLPETADLLTEAVVVLPGTHSKHLHVVGRRIVDFHTSMTGELFDVLRRHSCLRHSTGPLSEEIASSPGGPLDEAFREGVGESARSGLPSALFQVRTRQLLRNDSPASNAAFLSGLLIGAELASLDRWPRSIPVILAAGPRLAAPYQSAINSLGFADRLRTVPAEQVGRLSLLGHIAVLDREEGSSRAIE